jgi:hypothetical protein
VTGRLRAWARGLAGARPRVVLGVAWAIQLIYAFPGELTQDSFDHLREARAGVYSDAHPPIIDLVWRIVEVVIAGPFGMLLIQTGLLVGGLYVLLRGPLGPVRAAWSTAGVTLFPPVMVVMAVIWKDCMMAGLLAVGAAGLLAPRRWARLGGLVALVGATAFRYNALGATLPLIVLLFELRPGLRPVARYAAAAGAWLAVTAAAFAINGALTDKPMSYWQSSLALHDLVGTLARVDDELPDRELRPLLAPTGILVDHDLHRAVRAAYDPTDFLPLVTDEHRLWDVPINGYVPAPAAQRDAIARAWWATITAHPGAYAAHRLAVFAAAIDLGSTRALGVIPRRAFRYPDYAAKLGVLTGWSGAQLRMTRWMQWVARHTPGFVPWIYLVISLAVMPLAWRQRDALAVLASGVVLEATLLPLAHSRDFRYSHWLVITTLVGCLMVAARRYQAAAAAR